MGEFEDVVGVILAGGRGRRMGGADKCFVELAGLSLLSRAINRFGPQVSRLVLSANGDPGRFAAFDLPVLADPIPGFAGPLAGLLAAMEWVQAHAPDARWIASTSVDTPFLPLDLIAKLRQAQEADRTELVCAWSNGQIHPVCGLWRADLAADLRHALLDEDLHKVDAWAGRHRMATVDFSTDPIDPFFNINRVEDLARAEALLASHSGTPV
jgi:molybdopterin-guanine dinucleotide biosynthesis protein A